MICWICGGKLAKEHWFCTIFQGYCAIFHLLGTQFISVKSVETVLRVVPVAIHRKLTGTYQLFIQRYFYFDTEKHQVFSSFVPIIC